MGNEVSIRVTSKNDANPGLDSAAKSVGKIGDETSFVKKKAEELKAQLKDLTRQLDELGKDGSKSIEDIEVASKKLRTDIKKTESELHEFERILKRTAAQAAQAGTEIGTGMAFAGVEAFKKSAITFITNPAVLGGVALAAVGVAGMAGAVIGGAMVGGVGAGGMVGGILAATSDGRVKSAWADAVSSMADDVKAFGKPFVGPVIESIDLLKRGVDKVLSGEVGLAAQELGKHIPTLTKGFIDLLDRAGPGIAKVLNTAGPVLDELAKDLGEIGGAVGEMFDQIAEDPETAIKGMATLGYVIKEAAYFAGDLLAVLGQVNNVFTFAAASVAQFDKAVLGWNPVSGSLISDTADDLKEVALAGEGGSMKWVHFKNAIHDVGKETQKVREDMEGLAKAIDDVFNRQMGLDEATIRWHKGLGDLKKELLEGARVLGLNSEEGLKNRQAMLDQIEAAEKVRDATFRQTGDLNSANAAYQKNIEALYEMGRQAGFSKSELDALFGPYFSGVATAKLNFEFPGLFEGLEGMKRAADFANQAGSWSSLRSAERHAHGGIIGAASGGARGGLTWVGEQGPELVRLPYGSTVTPSGTSMAMASAAGGGNVTLIVKLIDPMTGATVRQVAIDDALNRGVPQEDVAVAYP